MGSVLCQGKVNGVRRRGRPTRNWTDDVKERTNTIDYSELKRNKEDRKHWKDLSCIDAM